jgi:hypothetical protein
MVAISKENGVSETVVPGQSVISFDFALTNPTIVLDERSIRVSKV